MALKVLFCVPVAKLDEEQFPSNILHDEAPVDDTTALIASFPDMLSQSSYCSCVSNRRVGSGEESFKEFSLRQVVRYE